MRDGGIYIDADVLLETNLDSFITPTMSFCIPRETIRDLGREDFCLWNGLIGAAPGHPFIVKAAERILRSISARADYFDVERETCTSNGPSAGLWKLRTLTTLILSGPCALGMAINDVLGKQDLMSGFEPGWVSETTNSVAVQQEIGDALILMVSTSGAVKILIRCADFACHLLPS